jgi:hypothetical protein
LDLRPNSHNRSSKTASTGAARLSTGEPAASRRSTGSAALYSILRTVGLASAAGVSPEPAAPDPDEVAVPEVVSADGDATEGPAPEEVEEVEPIEAAVETEEPVWEESAWGEPVTSEEADVVPDSAATAPAARAPHARHELTKDFGAHIGQNSTSELRYFSGDGQIG